MNALKYMNDDSKRAILKTLTIDECNEKIDYYITFLEKMIINNASQRIICESINTIKHYRACYEYIKKHK